MSKNRELADVIGTQGTTEQVLSGRRNLIINGGFDVSQRGDYTSATSVTDNSLALDRWYMSIGAGSATIQDLTAGAKMVATSSYSGNLQFRQKVERLNLDKLIGQTVTLSAKIKTNNSTDCRLMIYNGDWTTGSALHSGSGEFEVLTYTFAVPADGGYGSLICGVGIDGINSAPASVANGDYIEVEYVQLELGSVATPFEHRSYGEELALCQRYFEVVQANSSFVMNIGSSYSGRQRMGYKVTKRATPTISFGFSSVTNFQYFGNSCTGVSGGGTADHLEVNYSGFSSWSPAVGGCVYVNSTNTGSKDIYADAEL